MVFTRQYQTYYGINHQHWKKTWGGVDYTAMLSKEIPVGDDFIETTDYTIGKSISFIYPLIYLNKYYIDGLAIGHFSVYNTDTVSTYNVEDYTVDLQVSKDVGGDLRTLGSYTYTLSTASSVPTEGYLTFPIYMTMDKCLVEENEHIILKLSFTCSGDTTSKLGIAHANTAQGGHDMLLKIPYAPEG